MLAIAALALMVQPGQPAAKSDFAQRIAATGAVAFAQACISRLPQREPVGVYAKGADELGELLTSDMPAVRGLLTIDGADGVGCRVVYSGGFADVAWKSFADVYAQMVRGSEAVCDAVASTADGELRAVCMGAATSGGSQRLANVEIGRSGTPDKAEITALVTIVQP